MPEFEELIENQKRGAEWSAFSLNYRQLRGRLEDAAKSPPAGEETDLERTTEGSLLLETMSRRVLSETARLFPPLLSFDEAVCLELDRVNQGFKTLTSRIESHLSLLNGLVDKNAAKLQKKEKHVRAEARNMCNALEVELSKLCTRIEEVMRFTQVQWMAFYRLFRWRCEVLSSKTCLDEQQVGEALESLVELLLQETFMNSPAIEKLQQGLVEVYKKNVGKGRQEEGQEQEGLRGRGKDRGFDFVTVSAKLRNAPVGLIPQEGLFQRWYLPYMLGLCTVLLGFAVFTEVRSSQVTQAVWMNEAIRHTSPVVRFWLLVIFLQFGLAWGFWFMGKFGVNYRFLLSISNSVRTDRVCGVAILQFCVWLVIVIAFNLDIGVLVHNDDVRILHWYPLTLTLALIGVWVIAGFCFRVTLSGSFVWSILQVILDGFGGGIWGRPIAFADTLIADVMTSMMVPLRDLIMSLGYFATVVKGRPISEENLMETCNTARGSGLFWALTAASFFPLWIRMMQNLERVYRLYFPLGQFKLVLSNIRIAVPKRAISLLKGKRWSLLNNSGEREESTAGDTASAGVPKDAQQNKGQEEDPQDLPPHFGRTYKRSQSLAASNLETVLPPQVSLSFHPGRGGHLSRSQSLKIPPRPPRGVSTDSVDGQKESGRRHSPRDRDKMTSRFSRARAATAMPNFVHVENSVWDRTDDTLLRRSLSIAAACAEMPMGTEGEETDSQEGSEEQSRRARRRRRRRVRSCADLSLSSRLWLNALKYAVAMLPLLLATLRRCGVENSISLAEWTLGLPFKALATAYAMTWDYTEDWRVAGLSCNQYQRPRLYPKAFYVVAGIVNFLFRLVWTWSLTGIDLQGEGRKYVDHFMTVSGVLEIVRRTLWMVVRIEAEHCTNASQFRGLLFVPDDPVERSAERISALALSSASLPSLVTEEGEKDRDRDRGGVEVADPDGGMMKKRGQSLNHSLSDSRKEVGTGTEVTEGASGWKGGQASAVSAGGVMSVCGRERERGNLGGSGLSLPSSTGGRAKASSLLNPLARSSLHASASGAAGSFEVVREVARGALGGGRGSAGGESSGGPREESGDGR